jgi:hypothetical protein
MTNDEIRMSEEIRNPNEERLARLTAFIVDSNESHTAVQPRRWERDHIHPQISQIYAEQVDFRQENLGQKDDRTKFGRSYFIAPDFSALYIPDPYFSQPRCVASAVLTK